MELTNVLTDIFAVFTQTATWLTGAVQNIIPMFYGEAGLTFLGVLAIASLAISVSFLLIGIIQRFLAFRSN